MADHREALISNSHRSVIFVRCASHAQDELQSFRSYLRWMCVYQSNAGTACLSWSMVFVFAMIVVPIVSHFLLACSSCDSKHNRPFDGVVQLSLSRKLGDESETVRKGYAEQLNRLLKILSIFVIPCFPAESASKIWWYASGASQIPFLGNV